jgi:hypothetical protein
MQECYGEVLLKEGSILYHTSTKKFKYKKDKPLLFCTFHPSEYGSNNDDIFVHFIKLKKDIRLLFMIEKIKKELIFSSLHLFTTNERGNLSKMNDDKRLIYSNKLKYHNFDGWFSSINNKTNVEVALLNSKSLYELISFDKLNSNWIDSNYVDNHIIPKNWGLKYPICSINQPIVFIINERYKKQLAKYRKLEVNSRSCAASQILIY